MGADVEIVAGLERKLTFSVKKSDVDEQVKHELKKYAKKAKVSGFRPGKVPLNVVEKMYGSQAYQDSLGTQVEKTFSDLVVENKLAIANRPKFDLDKSEGEEFVFAAIFEVLPEVEIGDLSKAKIEKPTCKLTEDNIDTTILNLRKQRATFEDAKKTADNNDKVTIDFVGTIEGAEFDGGSAAGYAFVLGNKQMLPEFEAGILGMHIDETKEVKVKFPENYHAEQFRNKEAVFKITLKNVAAQQLPELNEEFIKSIGVNAGTLEALKGEIKTNLEHEITRRLNAITRENTLKALKDISPLEVPKSLVHEEIHHLMENAKNNMKQQGYDESQIKLTHEMFDANAKHLVTLRFLVMELIKQHAISVTDDEALHIVKDMAKMYDDADEYVKWYYTDNTRVSNAKALAMEKKVTDFILAKAQSTEVAISYEDLMQKQI